MKKRYYKNRKGSLLVGVAIVFLMISSLAVAIISRGTQGAFLATDAKKGYSVYQNSDKNAEFFLDTLKLLDNDGAGNKIPENYKVGDFCTNSTCLNKTGVALANDDKVKDIFNFKVSASSQGITRTINAPVSDRISGGLNDGSITVKSCDGSSDCDGSWNKCDIYIKSNDTPDPAGEVANYEVRRSIGKALSYGAGNFGEDYGWLKISGGVSGGYFDASNRSTIFKNGTDDFYGSYFGATSGGQYDNTYYFSIKARNKNPFSLDSLYLADGSGDALKSVNIGSTSCSGGDALTNLGCVVPGANPPGTETLKSAYNCCNGTECFHPSNGWEADDGVSCALQKCVYAGDEVSLNPSGDASSGWCKTRTPCRKGGFFSPLNKCKFPYRTVGVCLSEPDSSTQTSFFPSSSWTLSPKVKVYQGSGLDLITGSRCAYHQCPVASDVTNKDSCGTTSNGNFSNTSACSSNACGPYNFDINCNLSCDSGYFGSNSNSDYPQGTCCTKSCSDVSYSNWGDCVDHQCQENTCGDWTVTDDARSMPTCGADPVCGVGKSLSGTCSCTCSGCTDTRTCV